jgi:hypothetical protein
VYGVHGSMIAMNWAKVGIAEAMVRSYSFHSF